MACIKRITQILRFAQDDDMPSEMEFSVSNAWLSELTGPHSGMADFRSSQAGGRVLS